MAKLTSTVPGAVPGFKFRIDIEDFLNIGQVAKINNLGSDTDVITYRGGAEGDTQRKQKGLTTYPDLEFERIYTDNVQAWAALGVVFEPVSGSFGISSPIYKFNMTITLLDHDDSERTKFFVRNAWIKSFRINNLDANKSDYAMEQLTIAHEGISKFGIDI